MHPMVALSRSRRRLGGTHLPGGYPHR